MTEELIIKRTGARTLPQHALETERERRRLHAQIREPTGILPHR